MDDRIDLARYLERIGYEGAPRPDKPTLAALHRLHAEAIAFESLSPYTGAPVPLDLASLEEKIVVGGRGGYCYEQNHLFRDVLEQVGFEVAGHAARVSWNVPPGTELPRTHMVLTVKAGDETFLADVGFGGMVLTAPLHLQAGLEQTTPHENFRLRDEGGEFLLEARLPAGWKPLYAFDLQPQRKADYEMANYYVSTHPASRFTQHLIAARTEPGRRYALLDRLLQVHHLQGSTEKRELASTDEVIEVLETTFRIRLDEAMRKRVRERMG